VCRGGDALAETAVNFPNARKILILDGAMGTMIQRFGLTAADFGGKHWKAATKC